MSQPEIISLPRLPATNATYSQAVRFGDALYISGQLGIDPATGSLVEGGQVEQYRQALANLKAILEGSGTSLARVIKTVIYMTDVSQLAELNRIYADFFPTSPPAKTGVEVSGLALGAKIEIEAIAAA